LLWRSQEGPLLRVAPNEAGKTLKNPVACPAVPWTRFRFDAQQGVERLRAVAIDGLLDALHLPAQISNERALPPSLGAIPAGSDSGVVSNDTAKGDGRVEQPNAGDQDGE